MEGMAKLPKEHVDLVVTSPPYNLAFATGNIPTGKIDNRICAGVASGPRKFRRL